MKIQFTKMTGAGNDFVVIDNRTGLIQDGSAVAKRLCDRHWGIGGDGLLLMEPSAKAAYRMMYYNADGSYGGMCGNGGRCIARYAVEREIAEKEHAFEALDHVYQAKVEPVTVSLHMKDAKDLNTGIVLRLDGRPLKVSFVNTGSPHAVILAEDVGSPLDEIDVVHLGGMIRRHEAFGAEGTNANFISILDDNSLKMRTYERGVEQETLACGTGAIASGIIGKLLKGMRTPITIKTRGGQELKVGFKEDGDARKEVTLEGPAESVFSGNIDV